MTNTGSDRASAPAACSTGNEPAAAATADTAEADQATAALDALAQAVATADRAMATAVALAGDLARGGVCEQTHGLGLDLWLAGVARLPGADRATLITAGEVLAHLPTVAELFADAQLSWGQVRQIVAATKRLSAADRHAIDERLAATLAQHQDGARAFDPDQLVWAVDEAVDALRSQRAKASRERATRQSSYLHVQRDFEGGSQGSFALDPVATAALLTTLDAFADQPGSRPDASPPAPAADDASSGAADGAAGASDNGSASAAADGCYDADGVWQTPTRRGGQLAAALLRLCGHALGNGPGRPARPLVTVHVDLSQLTAHPDGTLSLGLRGPLSRISWTALEQLASDADLRTVLFDGARPLAASGTKEIPDKVRLAVAARDQGDRFPGSQDPIAHCDIHHVIERAKGGSHDPDQLLALSRRSHTRVHDHGWTLTLDPATGRTVFACGDLRLSSMPEGTRLARPPDDGPAPARSPDDVPF